MSHKITTLYSNIFQYESVQTVYATNDATGSQYTTTFPAGYYSAILGDSSTGTFANPTSIINRLESGLGPYYALDVTEDGKVKITYRGTLTGSVSFVSSSLIRSHLGFTSSSYTFNSGTFVTASYQPFGCLYTINQSQTDDWKTEFSQQAYEETAEGIVYGFKDDFLKSTRKQTFRFLPANQTFKDELRTNPSTPIFPVSKSEWAQPPISASSYAPPFTSLHFLRLAAGSPVLALHGTFQNWRSGTTSEVDYIYLRPGFIKTEGFQKLSIPGYEKLRDIPEIDVVLNGSKSYPYLTHSAAPGSGSSEVASIADLHAWWSAESVSYTLGYQITQVNDLSGNGRHLVQNTESRRPTYIPQSTGLGNRPTILFTGNEALGTAASHSMPRAFIIFFVLGNQIVRGMIVEHGNGTSIYVYAAGANAIYVTGPSTVFTAQNPPTTWAVEYQQGSARYDRSDGSQPTMRGNRVDLTETSHTGTTMSAQNISATWTVGARPDFSLPYSGEIAEIIVYSRKLNSTEITQVEGYLARKYSIT